MSSYKTLLIPILNEILIKEIGEANITPLIWNKISQTKYKFTIDINNVNEIVNVDFQQIEGDIKYIFPPKYRNLEKIYNVGYDISGIETQFDKTDLKTLLTILSTVIDIIKDFIKTHNPDGLYIRGTEKELGSGDVTKKTNLYKAYLKKQIDQMSDFKVDTYGNGFIVVKIKNN